MSFSKRTIYNNIVCTRDVMLFSQNKKVRLKIIAHTVYDASIFLSILDAFICLSYSINRAFEQTVNKKATDNPYFCKIERKKKDESEYLWQYLCK